MNLERRNGPKRRVDGFLPKAETPVQDVEDQRPPRTEIAAEKLVVIPQKLAQWLRNTGRTIESGTPEESEMIPSREIDLSEPIALPETLNAIEITLEVISAEFSVPVEELLKKSSGVSANLQRARGVAAYLLRSMTEASPALIMKILGGRGRGSVHRSMEVIRFRMSENQDFKALMLRLESSIQERLSTSTLSAAIPKPQSREVSP